MRFAISNRSSQKGQALLAMVIIFIAASAYVLVSKLNANSRTYTRQISDQAVLNEAKAALIGYALNFPEIDASSPGDPINGPGYLPCPDINNNGSAGGSCSSDGNTTIGRFPYETLEVSELRDSSNSRLWYALSDNYRNNPQLEPLNSETRGQLTVDANDDIVAVIIAPGAPIGNQNRDPADTDILTEITNYLETENNDLDLDFSSIDPSETDVTDFNDRLITITRQELMAVIEKRVLGEMKTALAAYKVTHGAYPWLSPFADPKAVARKLTGFADVESTDLIDSANNFITRGVAVGDVVYNISDGSVGEVSSVAANTLVITGLVLGTDNNFDQDDEYVVIAKATPTVLSGVATGGGDNDTLNDNTRNLNNIGVAVTDVVDNITDNSSAIITSISTNSIEVDGLSGGADNLFQLGDVYQIRSNYGVATNTAQSVTQVDDSNKDFVAMGVQAGELIQNITDGSFGRITTVNTDSLIVDQLYFGTNNEFSDGDSYMLPRLNTNSNSREGLLSLHETGEPFLTSFNLDWNVSTLHAGDIVFVQTPASGDPGYVEAAYRMAELYLQNYALSGSLTIDDTDAFCIWSVPEIAECYGYFRDYLSIDGRMTSGNNTDRIYDSAATLVTDNVKRGDIVQNYDDEITIMSGTADAGSSGGTLVDAANDFSSLIPYSYMIHNNSQGARALLATVVNDNKLETQDYTGSLSTAVDFNVGDNYTVYAPRNAVVDYIVSETELDTDRYTSYNPDFDNNEYYRVVPAGNSFTGVVDDEFEFGEGGLGADLLSGQVKLEDTSADFIAEGVTIGDVIYVPREDYYGEILALTATTITTSLYTSSGHIRHFHNDDDYTIFHDYVYSRNFEFHTKYSGVQATNTVAQERVRSVCLGYTADCSSVSTAVNFTGNGSVPFITIRDYEADGISEVGRATFTPSSASTGSLRTSDIAYFLHYVDIDLDGDGDYADAGDIEPDIPPWFINNDWHKLVYVAYSAGDVPNAVAACIAGSSCITLNSIDSTGSAVVKSNDNNAVVISAGMEINTTLDSTCNNIVSRVQNRTNGTINEYYESNNCSAGDDAFQQQSETATFNDQVRVIEP